MQWNLRILNSHGESKTVWCIQVFNESRLYTYKYLGQGVWKESNVHGVPLLKKLYTCLKKRGSRQVTWSFSLIISGLSGQAHVDIHIEKKEIMQTYELSAPKF